MSNDIVKSEDGSLSELPPKLKRTIINLLFSFRFPEKDVIKKSAVKKCSFILNELTIKKIEQYAQQRFETIEGRSETPISFSGEVSYADNTSEKYKTCEDLLKYAGDKKSPRILVLDWRVLLENPINSLGQIRLLFNTGSVKTNELNIHHIPVPYVEIDIIGVKKDWVEESFNTFMPLIKTTEISGIYKPLLVFKKQDFIDIFAWVVSVGLVYPIQLYFLRILDKDKDNEIETSKKLVLENILKSDEVSGKVDVLAKYILSPTERSSIFKMVLGLLLGFGLLYLFRIILLRVLPMLSPRSGILIGLEQTRFEKYIDAFKIIVVSTFILGIGSKIILEVISSIFF